MVAGASLEQTDAFCLVDMLSNVVRRNHGKVIFINSEKLLTSRLAYLIDFYIEADVQECARLLLDLLDRVSVLLA